MSRVRVSVVLLAVSLLGVLAGGWLTGRLGFGLAVIADSAAVGAWALLRDDGRDRQPQVHGVPTLHDVLERARDAG
jgi:hypothetical protein